MFAINVFSNGNAVIQQQWEQIHATVWCVRRKDNGPEKLHIIHSKYVEKYKTWSVGCFSCDGAECVDAVVLLNDNLQVTSVMTTGNGVTYKAERYCKKWQTVLAPIIRQITQQA